MDQETQNKFIMELRVNLATKISTRNDADVNTNANDLVNVIKILLDKYLHLTKLSRKESKYYYKPWITKGIKVSIRKRYALFKKLRATGRGSDETAHKRFRNKLSKIMNITLGRYERLSMK